MDGVEANLAQQQVLYGEPISATTGRITSALGLTQARLAQVLQLSAPMLSQLISGHRVKIGNPAVVHRLQALAELAADAPSMDPSAVAERLDAIRDEQATLTAQPVGSREAVAVAHLRSLAPAEELLRLADSSTSADLTALLRMAAGR